jgi:hypothetical protein
MKSEGHFVLWLCPPVTFDTTLAQKAASRSMTESSAGHPLIILFLAGRITLLELWAMSCHVLDDDLEFSWSAKAQS